MCAGSADEALRHTPCMTPRTSSRPRVATTPFHHCGAKRVYRAAERTASPPRVAREKDRTTATMNVLVLNCGSSSAKFAVIDPAGSREHISGIAQRLGQPQATLDWKRDGKKHSRPIPGAGHD